MNREKAVNHTHAWRGEGQLIGTLGNLGVLLWSLGIVVFSTMDRILFTSIPCLLVNALLYPGAFRRLFRLRWLFLLGFLILINGLWVGVADVDFGVFSLSWTGLQMGMWMALRAIVILLAVDGFSSSVDITEVAGLLERLGLPGLGFSIGVAVNLLPGLRETSANVWRSLKMRGGLRQRRWRVIQLFMLTLMANALHRGEEIALAAEVRAYTSQRTRALPLKIGRLDWWILAVGLAGMLVPIIIP